MRHFLILVFYLVAFKFGYSQQSSFTLMVKQDHKIVQAKNAVYQLKRKPFILTMVARNLNGFLVGATLDKDVYLSALGEGDLEVNWFAETGMAEEMFNKNKSILISNDAPSYWYYDAIDDHRFDKDPKGTSKDWIADRTIITLNDLLNEKEISIQDFTESLFLFIYKPYYNEEYELEKIDVLYHGELRFQ